MATKTSRRRKQGLLNLLGEHKLLVANVAGGLVVLIAAFIFFGGSGDGARNSTAQKGQSSPSEPGPPPHPRDIPLPRIETGRLRVYTPDAGFIVLVDGDVVLDEAGEPLTTPCAVTLARGTHTVGVAKKGFFDSQQTVAVVEDSAAIFEPNVDSLGEFEGVTSSPYFGLAVGEPVALSSINSSGRDMDPFVTGDGLALYFVSDRPEGYAVYYATRISPLHEFGPPQQLLSSRGTEEKASPTLSMDSLAVVYVLTEKNRIVELSRTSPIARDFETKQELRFRRVPLKPWWSAQSLDNRMRLYWVEEDDKGQLVTRASTRKSLDRGFEVTLAVELPGIHPAISSDGLRQYVFDGKTLQRARRATTTSRFSELEKIADLPLENYKPHPHRRQFTVTGDEQWLFYSDDPDQGDLHVVRLSLGRSWGVRPTGEKIAPRQIVAAAINENDPELFRTPEELADPRALPVPYTTHWKKFRELMASQKYDEARQLVADALANPKLAADAELLAWDRTDVDRVIGFWNDVRTGIGKLKTGDEIRFGAAKVEFQKFEADVVHAKVKTTEVNKPLKDMLPPDLLALADTVVEKTDPEGQMRMGTYLFYDPKGNESSAATRFDRTGDLGKLHFERLGQRLLHQAQQEFDRQNIAAGLNLLTQLIEAYPKSAAAATARQQEQDAYKLTTWRQMGRWTRTADGDYDTGANRAPNSYLMSDRTYGNFELRMEWKTTEITGQGGVFFRYRGTGDPYRFGFKVQLANDYGRDADPQTTGAIMNEIAPTENAVKPRGEWNTLKVRVIGEQVEVYVNDKFVLNRKAISTDKPLEGYVALDGVPGGIVYRKALLMELPK